jgi:hypothetical protein
MALMIENIYVCTDGQVIVASEGEHVLCPACGKEVKATGQIETKEDDTTVESLERD